MMLLHTIQENFGYFDDDAIKFAADKLGVRPIEVYGMISFYPMFSTKPRGRIHIKVCRTLSCAMAGSIKLGHEISKLVNCPIGETRGIYTLEFVECLGNCAKAPNVQVNDKLFEKVLPEEADKFVEKYRRWTLTALLRRPRSTANQTQRAILNLPHIKDDAMPAKENRIIYSHIGLEGWNASIEKYLSDGGYAVLAETVKRPREELCAEVEKSKSRAGAAQASLPELNGNFSTARAASRFTLYAMPTNPSPALARTGF